MKKTLVVLTLCSALSPVVQRANAQSFEIEFGRRGVEIEVQPAPVYVAPPTYIAPPVYQAPPVFVQPAPVVVGNPLCNPEYINGYAGYPAACIQAQINQELFYEPALRSQYIASISGCEVIIGGVVAYNPACVNGIQVGGIYFWNRVGMYHDYYFQRFGYYHGSRDFYRRGGEFRHEEHRREFGNGRGFGGGEFGRPEHGGGGEFGRPEHGGGGEFGRPEHGGGHGRHGGDIESTLRNFAQLNSVGQDGFSISQSDQKLKPVAELYSSAGVYAAPTAATAASAY